jgi:hypothetical protein
MSLRHLGLVAFLLATFVCLQLPVAQSQNNSATRPPKSVKEYEEIVSSYFPAGTFDASDASPDKNSWGGLALYLRGIEEPPLLKSAGNTEAHAYRLTIIAYPFAKTWIFRLQIETDGTAKLFAKQTPFNGTDLLFSKESSISTDGVNGLIECVKRGKLWQLPTKEQPEPQMPDGSYWFLEAVHHGEYHMVYRRTPELKPGGFTDIGRYLAKDLAHLPDSVVAIPRGDRSEPARRAAHQ